MEGKTSFWNRYGLMLLGILIYSLDLALIVFVTQKLYKNIVEVSVVTALPLTYFVIWLLRGKEGREKERKEWLDSRIAAWLLPAVFFAMALYVWVEMPFSLEWGYCLALAAGELLYQTCLRKWIPGWGQRISEMYVCILILEFFLILLFPLMTGMKTVNQAESILTRQGYEDIHYAVNTYSSGLELIFKDDVPELTRSEKKTGFYVFSAMNQGEAVGVVISPASGRIVSQAALADNLVLDLMVHH